MVQLTPSSSPLVSHFCFTKQSAVLRKMHCEMVKFSCAGLSWISDKSSCRDCFGLTKVLSSRRYDLTMHATGVYGQQFRRTRRGQVQSQSLYGS
ncbi:hypothetical protein V6N13_102884 [Hibiscus sabdariffa]|uniref:Uncharacterized protein n=1 Tax=Hibiscus sabdariffa TaxID=183260 RepID=A0ABR2D5E6_9ROSI